MSRHAPLHTESPVPRSPPQFPWTKEEEALLGKRIDREVAEKLNRTLKSVQARRVFLGRPALGEPPQPLRMEREPRDRYARLFAAKSNRELCAILGWSYQRIWARRRQLAGGKASKRPPRWSAEEDALLGAKPDRLLAREFGRSVSAIVARRNLKHIQVRRKWRPEDDKILGTRTDPQIALLLGRSLGGVAKRRRELGIPRSPNLQAWKPEEEALLGSKSDEELARAFGRTVGAVAVRRLQLRRPRADRKFKVILVATRGERAGRPGPKVNAKPGARYCTWTAEEDALLGKLTDQETARKLGYSLGRVRQRRQWLGVPANDPTHRPWSKQEIALLGNRPDREVAELVNRSLDTVSNKRRGLGISPARNPHHSFWKPAELALLGKLPDEKVARRTGRSLSSVQAARKSRGILSVRRPRLPWRPDQDALLGTAADRVIAARLGRTLLAVQDRRCRKSIPKWDGPGSA